MTSRLQEEATAATRSGIAVNPEKEGAKAPAIVTSRGDKRSKAASEFRLIKALNELSSPGGQLTGLELEMAQEARQEARENGIRLSGNLNIPSWLAGAGNEQRIMTAGTTTEGGYTVQTDIGRLIPLLDPHPIVRRMGATFLTGLSGNIDFPRNDAGAAAAWETETGAANVTSPTFDRVQMAPNRLAAYTDVSRQVMIQSTIDMENFVRNRLNQAVANALDVAALSGNAGNIAGLISESGVNTVTFAASPTWAKLVQMETEVAADDADFGTLRYLFHPRIAGILKTNERTSTNGIYLMNGPNNGSGQVNGYTTNISSQVPTAAGSYYGFFGNWAKMLIGQWGGLDILVDPYTQATTGTVRIVTNSYWDVAVEHGQAFTVAISMHAS
jgi:HK97 family phage major capsid protein